MNLGKKQVNQQLVSIIRTQGLQNVDISKRTRSLLLNTLKKKPGPVIYWMSRDQRINDNWALLYALQKANEYKTPIAVAFNLLPSFLGASARHFGFMLRGLKELSQEIQKYDIPFFIFRGSPQETIAQFCNETKASLLVTDYSPLRISKQWKKDLVTNLKNNIISIHEVDAHNIVPVWAASQKMEYMAKTIRPKIQGQLSDYLVEFPELEAPEIKWKSQKELKQTNYDEKFWDDLIEEVISNNPEVNEVQGIDAGESNAIKALLDAEKGFLTKKRLSLYAEKRNDPNVPEALSNLSPYLHFGQLAPQRAALEAQKLKPKYSEAVQSFLEELIIRRELSDNFCHYNENYDKLEGAYKWAQDTLRDHTKDKRPYLYSLEQLEQGKTHDSLWNAAQHEMVYLGKMHGYLRMYWAKKILEWTKTPQIAVEHAIYLNDKYSLDGRDPNGYVGCLWSIAGVHDRGWTEREIFGKIRYMNSEGCRRKFDIYGYVCRVDNRVEQEKQKIKNKQQIQQNPIIIKPKSKEVQCQKQTQQKLQIDKMNEEDQEIKEILVQTVSSKKKRGQELENEKHDEQIDIEQSQQLRQGIKIKRESERALIRKKELNDTLKEKRKSKLK